MLPFGIIYGTAGGIAQVRFPFCLYRILDSNSRKDRHVAKYSITKSVRWLGKISSKCVYFIDNPFKVVVLMIIFPRKSSRFIIFINLTSDLFRAVIGQP